MVETEQKKEQSLIDRVRQMAGEESILTSEWQDDQPVVLSDGYRRRSPLQPCRQSENHSRRKTAALIALLSVAVIALVAIVVTRFIQ